MEFMIVSFQVALLGTGYSQMLTSNITEAWVTLTQLGVNSVVRCHQQLPKHTTTFSHINSNWLLIYPNIFMTKQKKLKKVSKVWSRIMKWTCFHANLGKKTFIFKNSVWKMTAMAACMVRCEKAMLNWWCESYKSGQKLECMMFRNSDFIATYC